MKTIERIKLSHVLRLVSSPRYVLGTTYTLSLAFFESVVYPIIRNNQLKSVVILCDMLGYRRALSESAALQGAAQDYLVVPAPVAGAFHPKVWVVVGEGEAVLLCGSGNLTQAGFMNNAEYFDAVHFTAKEPQPRHLIQSLKSFVKGLATMWPLQDSQHLLCVEVLNQIADAIGVLPAFRGDEEKGPWFIHSFGGQLIDQLPISDDVRDLYIAAPYFGNSLAGLKALTARYKSKKLHVFPGIHGGNSVDIPLKQLAASFKGAEVKPLSTAAKKSALAHLKLYGAVVDKEKSWICCTSANCTQAAWQGSNIEAGLVRMLDRSACQEYFSPSKGELPERALEFKGEATSAEVLPCWASDMGGSLDVVVPTSAKDRLPLRDAVMTIRSGSRLATCERAILFQDGPTANISWSIFDDWERTRKMAVSLEISAVDRQGKAVHGQCLVENRLLLTADPIHRSAWRGALALLDAESVPELGDIAALFTLARDLFDGNVVRDDCYLKSRDEGEKLGYSYAMPAIAIWPPQPDLQELQKRFGRTAAGQIQWCQRIFQTFLRCEDAESSPTSEPTAIATDIDESPEEDEQIRRQEEEEDRARNVAQRIWDQAYREYSRLVNRLHELCPSEYQAPNLWAAAVFTFFPTLAILRAARRIAPDLDFGVGVEYLIEEFLRSMFDERKQDDNFICPKRHRYYPRETFPPLVRDLRDIFKVEIHPDLSVMLLSLLADWKLRKKGLYPQMWERLVRQMCGTNFVPGEGDRKTCRRIWRHYVLDEANKFTDAEFDAVFDELCRLRK